MPARSLDRSARIMAVALSRRRALQSAAGAAALTLAGGAPSGSRRARAATFAPSAPLYDLPAAAVRPPAGFGVNRGVSFFGGSGLFETWRHDERLRADTSNTGLVGRADLTRLAAGAAGTEPCADAADVARAATGAAAARSARRNAGAVRARLSDATTAAFPAADEAEDVGRRMLPEGAAAAAVAAG